MKTLKVIGLLAVILVISAGVLYWQNIHEDAPEVVHGELAQTINQCDLIASKAAAELPEALPFQKQEKFARQSRVLDRCMQDRGYQQNPAWVSSAKARASEIAHAQNISQDEAFETLRRQAMLKDAGAGASYWRQRS
ncbi:MULTISPECIES: hypothetical protein [unclassified Methylophilus]|uniref:hypothetical protein n=1 Tax=unclassified Methylophilus TaxID=2630143 RepID=UPI0006FE9950|nr:MULTISPECIES: hypothetical protein [unclassified Methylophilus]KQT41268.1 hypothetical protein ASG34_10980 [Methylophilus sp. Leaf416]KQT57790.1 hypothetical protein ASG44_12580 [Methylophilus sp. Leaf459]